MSSTNRLNRLLRLLKRLSTDEPLTVVELAAEMNVSVRTVNRDLKLFQDSGLTLHRDQATRTVSLTRDTFVPPLDLTLEEIVVLLSTCAIFCEQDKIPGYHALRMVAEKLYLKLPGPLREYAEESTKRVNMRLPHRSQPDRAGVWYEVFRDAVTRRVAVKTLYHSIWDGGLIEVVIEPYFLTFHRRTWYCVGKSSLHKETRTFHLGRVDYAEATKWSFRPPKNMTPETYFGNAWDMIRGSERHHARIRFQPKVARNVADVHWHDTQDAKWDGDVVTLSFDVDGIDEIAWWILGYGDQAEVLEPPELRERIRSHAESMLATYQSDSHAATE